MLLDQLCDTWDGRVLRFDSGRDDWTAFRDRAAAAGEGLLVIDSVDDPSPAMVEALAALLVGLNERQYAVLVGRAQLPTELHRLCVTGAIAMLDKDFVMFDGEEVVQLFLEYGIELRPADVQLILELLWGWAFGLHMLAQHILKRGLDALRPLIDETRSDIKRILVSDVVQAFPEQERQLMYDLSPFERFSEEMARMVTGRNDAPRLMDGIARKSYMLLRGGRGTKASPF